MKKTISYSKALVIMRYTNEFDIFQKSSLMCLFFDIPKEKTIEHIRTGYIPSEASK